MFGSMVLDTAAGIVLVYLLLSLLCSGIHEFLAWALKWRPKLLKTGIQQLLADPKLRNLADEIYAHPLLSPFSVKGNFPSYIPSKFFALALLDSIVSLAHGREVRTLSSSGGTTDTERPNLELNRPISLASLQSAIESLPADSSVRRVLCSLFNESVTSLEKAEERVADWFDNSMDRVSGWYKRRTHLVVAICAGVLSFALNADTLMIINRLSQDSALRTSLVAAAEEAVRQPMTSILPGAPQPDSPMKLLQVVNDKMKEIQFPLGWSSTGPGQLPSDPGGIAAKMLGLLLTTVALSLGAPFWFDLLNQIVNLRAAGKPPEKAAQQPKTS